VPVLSLLIAHYEPGKTRPFFLTESLQGGLEEIFKKKETYAVKGNIMKRKILQKERTLAVLITIVSLLNICGCNKKEKKMSQTVLNETPQIPIPSAKKAPEPAEASANGLGISDAKYEEIIKKSLVTKGNNSLVKKVLEKLSSGQEVIVAAIGGSITEGAGPASYKDGYVYQFFDMFTKEYAADASKVKLIPAGIGGTPSAMGLVRYEKDVLQAAGRSPDLLIVEFAVNDYLECTNTRGIEYIVRSALKENTAVIMLYSAATYQNQQGQISPVANFYNLPQVSISDGLLNSGVNQEKNSKVYYSDYVHPTKEGHTYMAKCLMNLIKEIAASEKDSDYQLPSGYKNANAFKSFSAIYSDTEDSKVSIQAGAFNKKDQAIQAYMHGGKCFPQNWQYDGSGAAEAFKMTLTCKSLIMVYKNANSDAYGKVDLYVDGKLQKSYEGHENGGWNNCMVVMVIDEEKASEHLVEIKAAQGDEAKSFTILAFGYAL